jgi:hypothetical protein
MKYLFLFMMTIPAYGALSPGVIKESSLKYHPSVLSALERMRAGEEAIVGARGVFDTKAVSDYRRQTKGDYRTTVSRC